MQLTTGKRIPLTQSLGFLQRNLNHMLINLHFTNSVIVMSHTDGFLLVMRHLLGYVATDLTGTVSVQNALAQF
jgi:hypothetical protein